MSLPCDNGWAPFTPTPHGSSSRERSGDSSGLIFDTYAPSGRTIPGLSGRASHVYWFRLRLLLVSRCVEKYSASYFHFSHYCIERKGVSRRIV